MRQVRKLPRHPGGPAQFAVDLVTLAVTAFLTYHRWEIFAHSFEKLVEMLTK